MDPAEDAAGPPLDLAAEFYVGVSGDAGPTAQGVLWRGEQAPRPGGGGPSYRLGPGESVTVNGVALEGGQADWGYLYRVGRVPDDDGRWTFRFVVGGRTVVRSLQFSPPRWAGSDPGAASLSRGLTLRWAPAFPAESERRGQLGGCVLNDRVEVDLEAMRVWGRLTVDPCQATARVVGTVSTALGAPFREGSLTVSVTLERSLQVAP